MDYLLQRNEKQNANNNIEVVANKKKDPGSLIKLLYALLVPDLRGYEMDISEE